MTVFKFNLANIAAVVQRKENNMSPPTFTKILREMTPYMEKAGWVKQDNTTERPLPFEKAVLVFAKTVGDYYFVISIGDNKSVYIKFTKREEYYSIDSMTFDIPVNMYKEDLASHIRNKMHLLFDRYLGAIIAKYQKERDEFVPILDFGFIPEAGKNYDGEVK